MLFTIRTHDFESEKERNLYYKYFAGYFFNELVKGVDSRIEAFCTLLSNCSRGGKMISAEPIALTSTGAHISFDNYEYLFRDIDADCGEFADILVHDRSTGVLIPIEAKVRSNWSYEKDILSNEARLKRIEEKMPRTQVIPCMLLTRNKWEASKDKASQEYSNYQQLIDANDCRTRVVLWDEFLSITTDSRVRRFLEHQLSRPQDGLGYRFQDDWFVRQ